MIIYFPKNKKNRYALKFRKPEKDEIMVGMKEKLSPKAKKIIEWANAHEKPFLIAIDGNSGSGKSRLGQELAEHLSASLIHMDDFFLRPEQKSAERLNEVGGNIDYERFLLEVIEPLKKGQLSSYRIYDCATQTIRGEKALTNKEIIIVEGVYSLHPHFGKYYDLSVFLSLTPLCQACRIKKRDGKEKYLRYKNEWIPKEDAYFAEFGILEKADIVFRN